MRTCTSHKVLLSVICYEAMCCADLFDYDLKYTRVTDPGTYQYRRDVYIES